MPPGSSRISVVPANQAACGDLTLIFGSSRTSHACQCQRYKLPPGESFASVPTSERARRLLEQTACDDPDAESTSGLVAYLDGDPVGWCAVEPRPEFTGLVRVFRVPWEGRQEDKADASVWAVTCLLVRAGFRKRGVSRALAVAAVDHARSQGAGAIEAYPITTKQAISEELHVGTPDTFLSAGLVEVSRPTRRRLVMRLDF